MKEPKVVILGVGNLLACDEGVGVHALVALEQNYDFPRSVVCLDGGATTHQLINDISGADQLIVLDAVSTGRDPGSIVALEGDAARAALTRGSHSHQLCVADLLETLASLGSSPKRVLLLAVEPAVVRLDLHLSAIVAPRVAVICKSVVEELRALGLAPAARQPASSREEKVNG
jgi:hydrogenase maturation protease